MDSDMTAVAVYVAQRSESALRVIVDQHINLVYAAAVRQVGGDVHLAKDVTQLVFTEFVRRAANLRDRRSLGGWFYTTTHHIAANMVRSERRRRRWEQEAHNMNRDEDGTGGTIDAEVLRPVLDAAMHDIGEDDREALVLRFLELLPMRDVAATLQISESAAAKRVERALDRLRVRFQSRGITSTAAALAVALEAQTILAAPAGLASAVTSAALAGSTGLAASAGASVVSVVGIAKPLVAVWAAAVIASVGSVWVYSQARTARTQLENARSAHAATLAKVREAETQLDTVAKRLAAAEAQNKALLASAEAAKKQPAADDDAALITSSVVSERFRRAQQELAAGQHAQALNDLLWCYNVGMPRIQSMQAVRSTSLLLFGRLAEQYPPAAEALRAIRDRARAVVDTSGSSETDAMKELAMCNHALKEDAANFALLDSLPAGDRRRASIALASYEALIATRRYSDAVAGVPYSSVSSSLERVKEASATAGGGVDERGRNEILRVIGGIEALAGAGDLRGARTLAQRLLDYDHSPATRETLLRQLQRAGQPTLLDPSNSN